MVDYSKDQSCSVCVCCVRKHQIKGSVVWSPPQWNVWGFSGTKLEWQMQTASWDVPRGENVLVSKNRSIVLRSESTSPPQPLFFVLFFLQLHNLQGQLINMPSRQQSVKRVMIRGTHSLANRKKQVVRLTTWKAFNRCSLNNKSLLSFLRKQLRTAVKRYWYWRKKSDFGRKHIEDWWSISCNLTKTLFLSVHFSYFYFHILGRR